MNYSAFNLTHIPNLLEYAFGSYYALIGRDALISLLVTALIVAIYLGSDKNVRVTLGVLLIFDFFLGVVLATPVILGFCIVSGLIGAYGLYTSLYN